MNEHEQARMREALASVMHDDDGAVWIMQMPWLMQAMHLAVVQLRLEGGTKELTWGYAWDTVVNHAGFTLWNTLGAREKYLVAKAVLNQLDRRPAGKDGAVEAPLRTLDVLESELAALAQAARDARPYAGPMRRTKGDGVMTAYLRSCIVRAQRAYAAGASLRQVARTFGVSSARVHQWLALGERAGMGRVVRVRTPEDRTTRVADGLRTATSWRALARALGYAPCVNARLTRRWVERAGYAEADVLLRFAENKDRILLEVLWAHCVRLGTPEVNTTVLQRDPKAKGVARAAQQRFGSIRCVRELLAARKKVLAEGLDNARTCERLQERN